MKLIIAGSRTFKDYGLLERTINLYYNNITEIVCGGADGADKLGEIYAQNHNIKVSYFPVQWGEYGKGAGMIRNKEMAKYADFCIVFWDGQSSGSKNMIDNARRYCKDVEVILYNDRKY